MPHAAIIRYIRYTKHFRSWNVYDNMCRMCRGSFWSWSEIDCSNFDKDMRYEDVKNDFYIFISSYLDLWPLNIKFAPLVTLVQSGVSIKLEVSMAFCFFICLWNLDLLFASCTSCTSAMHDITQLWGMCIIGKEEEEETVADTGRMDRRTGCNT